MNATLTPTPSPLPSPDRQTVRPATPASGRRRQALALSLASALLLTACGGGNTTSSTPPPSDNTTLSTDTERPKITGVTVGTPSEGLLVLSATATDNIAVTGYCHVSSTAVPKADAKCFQASPDLTVVVPAGHQTWWTYARDAAGNVSLGRETLLDLQAPVVTALAPVSISDGKVTLRITASDAHGVTGTCLRTGADTGAPAASDACFVSGDLASTNAMAGSVSYRAYARDKTGNVSPPFAASLDVYATIDSAAPVVTDVTVTPTADGVTLTAVATDQFGVAGYCFRTDDLAPPSDCYTAEASRKVSKPATFQDYKVYARDMAGRVSAAFSRRVDVVAPTVQAVNVTSLNATHATLRIDALPAEDVTGYCLQPRLNRVDPPKVPKNTDACFASTPEVKISRPIDVVLNDAYARDATGNVSAGVLHTLDLGYPSVISVTLGKPVSGQVPVNATAVDSAGVTGLCLRQDDIQPTASDACFQAKTSAFSASHAFSVALPTAETTLKVYARDAAGQVSAASARTFRGCSAAGVSASTASRLPTVCVITTLGEFVIELEDTKAPLSVSNFLSYVDEDFYGDSIFHRVMSSFMVQGGGYTVEGVAKTTRGPVTLERTTTTGLSNTVGSVALARSSAANSATSQFFVNVVDNASSLNSSSTNDGYAVFGRVISGMDTTVQAIRNLPVKANESGELSRPQSPPRILWAYRLK